MTSDRELLEQAAKAAGLVLTGASAMYEGRVALLYREVPDGPPRIWSPQEDDGQAFRLAAHLCMNVRHEDPAAVVAGWANTQHVPFTYDGMGPWHWKEWLRDHGNDRAAATRRAIIRAAAAIGSQQHD